MSMLHRQNSEVTDSRTGRASATSVTRSHFALSPGQVIGGVIGVVTTVIGVIAVTRGGIDGSLNVPVVRVAGLGQSAMVGVAEIVLGLLLIAGAASAWNRSLMGFVGGVMFIAGIVIAAASLQLLSDLGTDHTTGWTMLIGGVIAMVAAMLPTFVRDSVHQDLV
jgi:hypothetical protein